MPKPNARFWVYWNEGWVKLTLKPGQRLWFGDAWTTDEGWASRGEEYEYLEDEGLVSCVIESDGRDCDGRLSRTVELYCPIERLRAVPAESFPIWAPDGTEALTHLPERPDWTTGVRFQRDYAAEAAGY